MTAHPDNSNFRQSKKFDGFHGNNVRQEHFGTIDQRQYAIIQAVQRGRINTQQGARTKAKLALAAEKKKNR